MKLVINIFNINGILIFYFANSYEQQGKFRRQVKAQKLWFAILEAQTETGTPYMLYKDACNRKSNQQVNIIFTISISHLAAF